MPHVSPIVITRRIYKDTQKNKKKESHHVTTKSQRITKQDSKKDKEGQKSYKKGKSC